MYYNDNTVVFLNGEFVKVKDAKVSPYSQTLHYGNGVFEGIRSYKTPDGVAIFKAKEHYERLLYSAKVMFVPLKYSVQELIDINYELLKRNNLSDSYIRPIAYMNENIGIKPNEDASFFMAAWDWPMLFGNKPMRLAIADIRRPHPLSCDIKAKINGHYVNSIMAGNRIKNKGYDDALLLDTDGYIAEGPGANFFFEKGGKLFTASLGNILPGITRATILELCKELGISCEEKLSKPEELKDADGAFFVGTAAEVVGIESVNDVKFKKDFNDTLGFRLQKEYKKLVTKNLVLA